MPSPRNPFTPAFGTVPPVMAGRESILTTMGDAFETGPGDPNLSTILIGARGTGKTVCMTCIADEAAAHGWVTANTMAIPGMLDDIYESTLRSCKTLLDKQSRSHLPSVTIGPISAGWDTDKQQLGNWRSRMTDLLDELDKLGTGLLISVDEVHANLPEMIMLAAVYQLFVREGRHVALLMAGLPYHVDRLLTNESVSFLRRSQQHRLGRIIDADVRAAFRRTIEEAGKEVAPDALEACVQAIGGFAYMLQLVGYRTWIESDARPVISLDDAQRGIAAAQREIGSHILATTYRDLSDGDLRFLNAMLLDKSESTLANISRRMGVASNYASKYKSRLLSQGIIGERGRNVLGFDIPGFRGYLTRMADEQEFANGRDA